MSSIALTGNAAGAGVFTIASPNSASSYTATLPTQTGTLVSGTSAANAVIPAGTTAIAPILLTSGTNLTSATAGAMEYDGKVIYATPIGTQRGIVPTQQYYRLDSAYAGSNATGAQSLFGVGVTLSASTVYEFEGYAIITKTVGTTSHNISLGIGGTATLNNIGYSAITQSILGAIPAQTATGLYGFISNTATATVTVTNNTSASISFAYLIKGTVSINAGGTFIPQYTLSAAPGGAYTTQIGSYIKINPLSASGAATNVGAWS